MGHINEILTAVHFDKSQTLQISTVDEMCIAMTLIIMNSNNQTVLSSQKKISVKLFPPTVKKL